MRRLTLFNHSFINPFFVFGNLNPCSKGSTAACTRRHADESCVSGDEWAELEFESTSRVGDLFFEFSPFDRANSNPTALSLFVEGSVHFGSLGWEGRALSEGESIVSSPDVMYESVEFRRLRRVFVLVVRALPFLLEWLNNVNNRTTNQSFVE